MAISTALLKRLNSDEEPLPKRLKLAENALYTTDIPLAYKEDLIIQWLCKTCISNQNVWHSLKHCLKTKHLDFKTDTKKLLIKTFTTKLQDDEVEDLHENIFECCRLLVSNIGMQQYFINEPNDLRSLMKSLLDSAFKLFKQTLNINEQLAYGINITVINKSNGLILIAYDAIISVLENMIEIYKSAFIKKDNLRTMFICDILYSLCAIIDHKCTDNTNRLRTIGCKCVQEIIFGKRYAQSGTFVKDENTTRFADLLFTLSENAKTKDLQCNLITFTFFFDAAIDVFKSDSTVLDLILRELIECAGIHKKQILNSLLGRLNDITFDFSNKIHGVTLFDYCQNIIDDILWNENLSTIDYNLLTQFCCFNPLIIEKKIPYILRKVFLGNSTSEYTNLMISILNATVHLRQEQKLISVILIALKDSLSHMSSARFNMFFPHEFKEKFMNIINNITNSQGVAMLRTLIYHLEVDCMEILQSDNTCTDKNVLIIQAIVELLTTLLDGVCIFEYTGTLTSHQKFVNALNDLGNVLSLLIDQILYLNHSKKLIALLLAAVFSWNGAQNALKYYVPKVVTYDLTFPISQDQWQQLIQRITNFGENNCKNSMNKLILQEVKMSPDMLNESSIKLNSLIGGLKYSWCYILKFNTELISLLSDKQMLQVTHSLLTDMISNIDSFYKWSEVLHRDSVQENKRFIISLLYCVITQIGYLSSKGVTSSMSKHFVIKSLLEVETIENGKIDEILMRMKEELLKYEWIQIGSTSIYKIKIHLDILLHIPLMFLNDNIRLMTFMVIFALKKECNQNDKIIFLCDTIFSDLLEKSSLDIFRYIDPPLLLQQLPQNRIIQKSVELSLRNNLSYRILKELIQSSTWSMENMYFLLESIEYVKPKLNTDQKVVIKKIEKKLSKIMIKMLPSTIAEVDLKVLNLILKINITNKIDEKLKDMVELTLQNIFMSGTDRNNKNELLQNGLQLAVIVLHNRKMFQVMDQTMKGIWYALFKYPCTDVLLPLLESSEPKEFYEFLEYLHDQMVKILSNLQENDLENICIIWNAILKTNMSIDRSKLRLATINKLIQTIQTINIPDILWPSLLKLIQSILTTKHLYLPSNVIDISIFLGLRSLHETTILTCSNALELCSTLLKTKPSLITDRLPALLVLYRRILNVIVHKSKTINNKSEEHMFKCLTLDVEKFTSSLIKLKKDMIRLSPYLIADLLELFSQASIATFVKVSMQNCLNLLISICDQHGISLLSRTLPVSIQEIFKSQLNAFNKFYKFSGKI